MCTEVRLSPKGSIVLHKLNKEHEQRQRRGGGERVSADCTQVVGETLAEDEWSQTAEALAATQKPGLGFEIEELLLY